MKKIICTLLIICIVALPFSVSANYDGTEDNVIRDVQVQVHQQNTGYAGLSNNSPIIEAPFIQGILNYPQSLCMTNSNISILNGDTIGTNIDITISYPGVSSSHTIYVAVCNTFGVFNSQNSLETYFNWNSDARGYFPKTGFTGSWGYLNPSNYLSYSVPTKANRVATYELREGGITFSNSSYNGSPSAVDVGSANMYVPQSSVGGSGGGYDDFYFLNSGNNVAIYRIDITRDSNRTNWPYCTVKLNIPSSSNNKCTITSGSNNGWLHSAVYIPMVIAYDTTSWNADIYDKVDTIVSQLATINTNISSLGVNLNTIISLIGTGDVSIIEGIESIITTISTISASLAHLNIIGGGPTGSAVQYIEYYMREVSSNTSYMKNQLADILSTLTLIADTLDDANEQLEDTADTIDGQHDIEQGYYDQVNQDIGNIVISNFQFDANTSSGMARAGLDFTALWNSLGSWNNVYTFSMTITVALTIIRYISAKPSRKQTKKESKSDG